MRDSPGGFFLERVATSEPLVPAEVLHVSKRPLGRTFGPRYLDDSSCVVSMEYGGRGKKKKQRLYCIWILGV